jgi:hypothetical protein
MTEHVPLDAESIFAVLDTRAVDRLIELTWASCCPPFDDRQTDPAAGG